MGIPALLTPDGQLTTEGEALRKFADAQVRQQRADGVFEKYMADTYRIWAIATGGAKAWMTVEQFIGLFYKNPESEIYGIVATLWPDYLNSLSPSDQVRAVIPNLKQEAATHKIVNGYAVRLNESIQPESTQQEHKPMNTRLTFQEQRELTEYLRTRARSERGLPYNPQTAAWTDMVEAHNMPPADFFKSFDGIGRELYALMNDDAAEQLNHMKESLE